MRDTLGKCRITAFSAPAEIMPAVHFQQLRPSWNQFPRLIQLDERAEGIGRPNDEECGHAEGWKVGDAEVAGPPGRVQRIGLKQKAARQHGLGGEEHRGLAAPVGVPAEEEAAADAFAEQAERGTESFTIALGAGWRRAASWTGLAERQIAAQDGDIAGGEGLGHRHQKWHVGVAAGAMGEHEAVGAARRGRVQKAADGRVSRDVNALDAHGGGTVVGSLRTAWWLLLCSRFG
jgi:hypothetical protein